MRVDRAVTDEEIEARERLLGAIHVIDALGWAQGRYVSADGAVCALGALGVASGIAPIELPWSDPAYSALRSVASTDEIGAWNDRPRRTKDQVVDALQRAADKVVGR